MEDWKLLKQIKRNSGALVKYLVSNKGRVKLEAYLNDKLIDHEELYIGHGMYIYKEHLGVYHLGKGEIYRNIYKLFKGNIPKGYQIHHIDYNHYNNNVDNLLCCSAYEHGKLHAITNKFIFGYIPNNNTEEYIEYNKWLDATEYKDKIDALNYRQNDARIFLLDLYNRFDNVAKELIKQNRIERIKKQKLLAAERELKNKQEYEKQKQLKIESGEYYLSNTGKLIKKNRPKWTTERRNKTMTTRYETVYNSEEWINNIYKSKTPEYIERHREGVKRAMESQELRDRISKSVKQYYINKRSLL